MLTKYGQILAVTDRHLSIRSFYDQIRRICAFGPDALILREKDMPEDAYQELAHEVLSICNSWEVPCILHTYWRTAENLKCDSIHLPLPVLRQFAAERIHRDSVIQCIGTSVHSVEEALEAQQLGASYLTAGHIYSTDCKKGLPPRGTTFLQSVCSAVDIPVYGIGGIKFDETQWQELHLSGAAGGCIMSGMMTLL